eukprot:11612245-Alexandrium_andersonii.AAC.1
MQALTSKSLVVQAAFCAHVMPPSLPILMGRRSRPREQSFRGVSNSGVSARAPPLLRASFATF